MDGFVRRAGEGDARWFYGNLFVIKVGGADTQGRVSLIDCTSPPGFAPGTHVHAGEDEIFYVLQGRLEAGAGIAPGPRAPVTWCSYPATPRTISPSRAGHPHATCSSTARQGSPPKSPRPRQRQT